MAMAQGIRRIVRLRNVVQAKQHLDHLLDLVLIRPAIARHRLLDIDRIVFIERDVILGQVQHDHAAGFALPRRGFHVLLKKKPFHRRALDRVAGKHR